MPEPEVGPTSERYHALDCLRGFAMFLGVVLHAGVSFLVKIPPFWPVRDRSPTPLADVFLLAVHDFRMQLFFLLAGFFGCLLFQRYGVWGMARHRVKRVAVPFMLAMLLIMPTVQAVGLYAEIENVRASARAGERSAPREYAARLLAANPDATTGEILADYFLSGEFLRKLVPLHLWFLYYLLAFYAAVVLLAPLLGPLSGTRLLAGIDAAFRRVVAGRGRVVVPAVLTFPLMFVMFWVVDTPAVWLPPAHLLAYYFGFFVFGWMLYRHRDLVGTFGRGWGVNLAIANLLVLPVMIGCVLKGVTGQATGADVTGLEVGAAVASVLYTWLMITGLWGAGLRLFSRESAWVRYAADASYWCYLAGLTPILLFQFWVRNVELPGLVKFAFVATLATAVLLASYEWCVRYTFVGAILNGPKHRPRS